MTKPAKSPTISEVTPASQQIDAKKPPGEED